MPVFEQILILVLQLLVHAVLKFVGGMEYLYKRLIAPPVTAVSRAVRENAARRRSLSWALSTGTVEWVNSEEVSTGWRAELSYSYRMSGEFNSGYKRVKFGREVDLDTFKERYRTGHALRIRCDPEHPERSVVLESEQVK